MKIRSVRFNNKRKDFQVATSGKKYAFPYVKARPNPTSDDPIIRVYVDKELGGEGFSYELQSGKTGTVHMEQVLEYNRDPNYLRDLMLYKLTVEAQRRIAKTPLSKREIIRSWVLLLLNSIDYWIKLITKNSSISSCPCFNSWNATWIWWCGQSPRSVVFCALRSCIKRDQNS